MNILANLNISALSRRRWFGLITATIALYLALSINNDLISLPIIISIFTIWALSISGLGAIVSQLAGLSSIIAQNFILGLATSAVVIAGILSCHASELIASKLIPLILMLLFTSGAWGFFNYIKVPTLNRETLKNTLHIPGLILISYVALRYFQSLTPDMHPDALWYHLTAPLFWHKSGGFNFNPDAIQLAQASYWECLFIWPLSFFGNTTANELIKVHIFTQLLTVSTWLATGLSAADLLRKTIPVGLNKEWRYLVILAALTTAELSLSYPTPKNDWGVAAFFITSVQVLIHSQPVLAGALLGITFVSKFSYAIPIGLSIGVALCYLHSVQRKAILLLSFTLFVAPILLRNLAWTSNPFFPLFNSIFKSEYLPAIWNESLKAYNGAGASFELHKLWLILLAAFPLNQAMTLLLLTPKIKTILNSYWSKRIGFIILLSILLFAVISGPRAELRLIGVIPILISAASIYALYLFRSSFIIRVIPFQLMPSLIALYLVIFSETPWRKLINETFLNNQTAIIDPHSYLKLTRETSDKDGGSRILFAYDTKVFYLLNHQIVRVWDSPQISEILEKTNATNAVKILADEFRYLVVTNTVIDNFQRTEPIQAIQKLAKNNPKSIISDNNQGMLIDLFILRSHLMGTKE